MTEIPVFTVVSGAVAVAAMADAHAEGMSVVESAYFAHGTGRPSNRPATS